MSNVESVRDFILRTEDRVEQMLEQGTSREEILGYLTSVGEAVSEPSNVVVSILILDEFGLLRNGASPRLPADYLSAIDKLKPHPKLGTCASAAATGNMVITPDFLADDKWAELKHLPLALGFVGAWSIPIISESGKVLGTFGTYLHDVRRPSDQEIVDVKRLASLAAKVIEQT